MEKTDAIQDGNTVVLTVKNKNSTVGALVSTESGSLSVVNPITVGGSVVLGETTYSSSLTGVENYQKWFVTQNSDGTFSFQNAATNEYLAIVNGSLTTSETEYDGTIGNKSTTQIF